MRKKKCDLRMGDWVRIVRHQGCKKYHPDGTYACGSGKPCHSGWVGSITYPVRRRMVENGVHGIWVHGPGIRSCMFLFSEVKKIVPDRDRIAFEVLKSGECRGYWEKKRHSVGESS